MGVAYRAMRLAEFGSLQDLLGATPQSPFFEAQRATMLFQEITEGLEYIHSMGYIHGNINPSNILLDAMLHPLLSDFGVPAKISEPISPFLAPEQVQGGMIDRRTDVYGLGVLLYTILVGEAPPAGVVVSARSRRPDIPESVDRVIFKAMAQNPDQRFQSASEFFNAVRAAFTAPLPAAQPVYTPPPAVTPIPTVSQTVNVGSPKKGPNWIGIVLGVIVVLLLCIGGIFIYQTYFVNQTETPSAPTEPAQPATQLPPIIIMPTQPPAVTQVLPTKEQKPTQPPENPTQPPVQPPAQQPEVEQPIAPPAEETPGNGLFPCGSVGLIAVPMMVLGANHLKKKHRI